MRWWTPSGPPSAPELIDSHRHVVLGDDGPRQKTVDFLASYAAARASFEKFHPGGMTVHAGIVMLEPTPQERDFADLEASTSRNTPRAARLAMVAPPYGAPGLGLSLTSCHPRKVIHMGYKIGVDLDLCQGYANCVIEASAIFDIDDETDKAIILVEKPSEDQRTVAENAVRGCPAQAIFIDDEK